MQYSNPLPPEDINVGKQRPLRELLILTTALFALAGVLVITVGFLASKAAEYVPFATEIALTQNFAEALAADHAPSPGDEAIRAYLQTLAERQAEIQNVPADMPLIVHYVDDETVNAFATLGGHVVVFRGLLEKVSSENALAMIIGHEIAHVQKRHPIRNLGWGFSATLVLSTLTGIGGENTLAPLLGGAGELSMLHFSRGQEYEADALALRGVAARYGHVGGANELFRQLLKEETQTVQVEFLRTHPLTDARIHTLAQTARGQGWNVAGDLQALPDFVRGKE